MHALTQLKGILEKATPPIPPSEVFEAGISIAGLRKSARYAQSPDYVLKNLAHDLDDEDTALKKAVTKGRLEMWWPGMVEGAKSAVRREADELGEERALREQAMRGFGAQKDGDGDEDVMME